MDLRTLPPDLNAEGRADERRKRVEMETGLDLSLLYAREEIIGQADERNCEQMIGMVSVPVGYAGPLSVTFGSGDLASLHLPLATTEGALVASVNRGCKVLSLSGGVRTSSVDRGMTRSLAFHVEGDGRAFTKTLREKSKDWQKEAESTSGHLTLLSYDIDVSLPYVFLTLSFDTSEAMGMNMVTIASQAAGEWILGTIAPAGTRFSTVAANVDSDKKPSKRTKEKGRGFTVDAQAFLDAALIEQVLKTLPEAMQDAADAKLIHGSQLAGAVGSNLQVANVIAALAIATGQDPAHTVEGSLTDTVVTSEGNGLRIRAHLPAVIVAARGGGTALPSQAQCLRLLLHPRTALPPKQQLAESIGAAVLAGEISLLAAQASHTLACAHKKLARGEKSCR